MTLEISTDSTLLKSSAKISIKISLEDVFSSFSKYWESLENNIIASLSLRGHAVAVAIYTNQDSSLVTRNDNSRIVIDSETIVKYASMVYPEGDMSETQGTSEGAAQQEDPKVAILRDALEKEFMAAIPPHLRNDTELSSNLLTLAHQLAEEQAVQEREKAELEKLAVLDSLIPNFFKHSYFLELLGQEVVASARKTTPDSALIVLDLDNFRTFNTRFGHPAGDRLLKSAGKIMLESLRSGDDPGRVGGDELAAIVHRVALDGAVAAARRLQTAVIQASQEEFGPQGWTQTISAGVCLITPRFSTEILHGIVDKALYASKHAAGKNRISIVIFNPTTKSVEVTTLPPKPTTPSTSTHT